MNEQTVFIFKPFPFEENQKIHIADGPRKGDWLVVGVTPRKVRLRCPISLKEFEWNRFCYLVEKRQDVPWPREE